MQKETVLNTSVVLIAIVSVFLSLFGFVANLYYKIGQTEGFVLAVYYGSELRFARAEKTECVNKNDQRWQNRNILAVQKHIGMKTLPMQRDACNIRNVSLPLLKEDLKELNKK